MTLIEVVSQGGAEAPDEPDEVRERVEEAAGEEEERAAAPSPDAAEPDES